VPKSKRADINGLADVRPTWRWWTFGIAANTTTAARVGRNFIARKNARMAGRAVEKMPAA
jgi:hypothetical protein